MLIVYVVQMISNIGFMGAQVKGQGQIKVTKSRFWFKGACMQFVSNVASIPRG